MRSERERRRALSSRAERGICSAVLEPFPHKIPRSARDDSEWGIA